MRISKDPEVRKQEIIDAAMGIFSEKGFEAVTMKDIAQAVGVATGLCYHYFPNKQVLYETAVNQYAETCSREFIEVFKQTDLTPDACMAQLWQVWQQAETTGAYTYASFFHKEGNEFFHAQLDTAMARKVTPYIENYLRVLQDRGEIPVLDSSAAAKFIVGGQMAIINDQSLSLEARFQIVRQLIIKVLN